METAAKGLPGAYVEEQDSFIHSLQVAIPPWGTTHVELVLEELLQQRLGEIKFEIPFAPNEKVDQIALDLNVEDDSGQGATDFHLDEFSVSANATSFHLDLPDAHEHALPKVLRGRYTPGEIPNEGMLYTEGQCFEHFFRPVDLGAMPRNLLFLIDTSYSMRDKMTNTKEALRSFIKTLKPEDTFTIQPFQEKGTDKLWGSARATEKEIGEAELFIDKLRAGGDSTDLHEALLEGLLRAKRDAERSGDDTVTILCYYLMAGLRRARLTARGS